MGDATATAVARFGAMTTLAELVDRYTEAYHRRDEATFRAMVADGCVRHDPGASVAVPIEDNVARFRAFHERFPGARFTNAAVFAHGPDGDSGAVTVCYTIAAADTVVSGIEVFRFAGGVIVEVWNAPVGQGRR